MSVLVINCNHWIGFHIVNTLLKHDYIVDGIEKETESDELSLFFGRNSAFSFYNEEEKKRYDTCICVGGHEHLESIYAERIILINPEESYDRMNLKNITTLFAAHLFGEWMTMNEKGYYRNQEFIAFHSNVFKENAIYIEDFTEGLIQWLQSSKLPPVLNVKSDHHKAKKNNKNPNSIYIRSSLPLEKRLTAILKRYQLINIRKKF